MLLDLSTGSSRPKHLEELARASTSTEVCEILLRHLVSSVAMSGVNVMPFSAPGDEAPRPALYLRDGSVEEVQARLPAALQLLLSEPKLPDLFATPERHLRVEEALGWESWIRSATYQEHFRFMNSARQFVLGFANRAGVPRGFLAASRAETDAPFDAEEQALLFACRDEAERALAPFAAVPDWSRPLEHVLDALTLALPTPALLIGDGGRILWMNREAELRFGAVGLAFGSERFYASTHGALRELLELAVRERDRPGTVLGADPRELTPGWLAPGETVIVRRVAPRGAAACVFVCLHAPVATEPRAPEARVVSSALGLSAREAEIATLAADGYSVHTISHRLGIAQSTVSSHLKRVYRKLGICSRVELAQRLSRPRRGR